MPRTRMALMLTAGLAVLTANCSRTDASRAETQAGAAADLNRGPQSGAASATCRDLPSSDDLKKWLRTAPGVDGEAGGLFSGKRQWAAIVNRQCEICTTAVAMDDPASAWPGSQAIAKAKAYTANSYSTDDSPLSTARLYTLTQPGHSLWGVAQPNTFDPACVVAPSASNATNGRVRMEFMRPGEESWWSLAPTVVHRLGIGRGDLIGSWVVIPALLAPFVCGDVVLGAAILAALIGLGLSILFEH